MASSPSTRQYEREAKHSEDRIYVLRLYIAGFAPASMRTLAHLRALCDSHFKGRCQLEVIDILQRPDLARADRIIAVPALVQESPPPKRTRIEDLLRQKTGIASFEKHPVIDTLRRHLEEDEGGLHAIRRGEIDALVVSGPKGDQIYLVEAVEQANRRCLEAGNEGNLMLLADGTIAYGNQRFADLLRIPLQQIIGAALATLAAPSSRGPLQALLQQALTAKTEGEISFVTGEGALLWLKLSLWPADPARPIGMCLAATDITARKRAEETRSHLAAIVESSTDAIIGMDLDGKILSWNSGAQNLYGYSAAQAMGRSVSLLVPPERLGELASNLLRIKAGEAVDSFQTERLRKGGERVPVAIAISPIRDANGYITGASSIARDITGSKRAEAELRRAGAYNRRLIEASPDPLLTIAPNGTITDVNQAAEQVTGRSWQELIGTDFYVYFTDREKARGGFESVFREGFIQDYELEMRGLDGRLTPVLYNASVYRDENGKVAGIVALARDITERKRAEAEIRALNAGLEARIAQRTAELVAANKELEAFSYSVSHDLRVPLRAMEGFAKAIAEECSDQITPDAQDLVRQIRGSAQRMAEIINGLLALARTSRAELRRNAVDLSALAQSVGSERQKADPERAVEFLVAPGLVENADPNLLRTVLENLLDNAWKFTSKHPRARIEVGALEQDGQKVYFVKDDGAGFDMAYAGKLFQAFQRLHSPAEFEGTGIGLATVQRIIQRHGGKVWAEGEVEKGATFFFTLPG